MTHFLTCGDSSGGEKSFFNSHLGNPRLGLGRASLAGSMHLHPLSFAISWARHCFCFVYLLVCFSLLQLHLCLQEQGRHLSRLCAIAKCPPHHRWPGQGSSQETTHPTLEKTDKKNSLEITTTDSKFYKNQRIFLRIWSE